MIGKNLGLRQNMIFIYSLLGIVLIAIIFPVLNVRVTRMEEDLISDRLVADIHYIEDLIGEGDWVLKDGSIGRGDVMVGDGTEEKANLAPFLLHEEKTGTFAYVFVRCSDEGLGYVESTPTQAGYQQGHFLRVAGSTKDPNGNSIVGTYMDKIVADILDEQGVYDGEANVAGGMIFCRYETLKNAEGEVIGAIVVGRSINELKEQIQNTISSVVIAGGLAIIIGCFLLFTLSNRWVNALKRSTRFLQQIESGDIPQQRFAHQGLKEVDILNQGINSLADTLTENKQLRILSETDQLTGTVNRFGLNHYGEEMFEAALAEKKPVGVGVLDVDYFKLYNDNFGHQEGDNCILQVARVLKKLEEPGKILVSRYGGDEFVVVSCGLGQDELMHLADNIRSGLVAAKIPHPFSKASSLVTLSQGYYLAIPEEGQSLSTFLSEADGVMYEIKNGSKNGYRIRTWQNPRPAEEDEIDQDLLRDIEWNTYHDYLTNLLNSEGFYREVSWILKQNPRANFYIVRSNIKEFKLVNQLFGYEKGNEILQSVAEMLQNGPIQAEAIGRMQGDHFAFLIKKKNFDEDLIRRSFLKCSKAIESSKFAMTFHLGVYPIQDKTLDVSIMCDRANLAIHSIYNESELTIAFYDQSMIESILREKEIITEFESSLQSGEFCLFLQPIINREERLVGAEALVRWIRQEGKSVILPGEFIGVLEKYGLIHKLDALMWEEAARILQRWKGTNLENVFISVNVSPQDDNYLDIAQEFMKLTRQYGIKPGQLNPEFTETTLVSDIKRYIQLVSSLQEKGFRVEIDDFGSGYSSLNMLNDIPADVLKIDRLFVGKSENKSRNYNILASIIEMSKKLDMTVIAEGVETLQQFSNLFYMGCDLFQGYYFSNALPLGEFERKYMYIKGYN